MLVAGNAISLSFFSFVKCLVSFLNFRIWRFSLVIIGFLKLLCSRMGTGDSSVTG